MKDYSALKREIQTYIRTNNNQEITGEVLQNVLVSIVSNVGENAGFGGIAKKTTSPGTPDGPVFYFATEQGVYPNFGGLEIERENTLNIIYNTEDGWDTLFLGNLVPNEEVEDFRTFKHLENMNFEEASEYCATFDNIIEKIGGGAIRFSRPVIFTFSNLSTEQGVIINLPSSGRVITQYAFTKGNVNSGFSHRLIQYNPTSLTITNVGEWKPISSLIPAATTSATGLMSADDKVKLGKLDKAVVDFLQDSEERSINAYSFKLKQIKADGSNAQTTINLPAATKDVAGVMTAPQALALENSIRGVSPELSGNALSLILKRNNGSTAITTLPFAKSEGDGSTVPNAGIMSIADKEVLGNTGDINVGSLSDNGIDTYTIRGTYRVHGERTNANDGLPILNSNPGHTVEGILKVLDSSISGSGEATDKVVTQVLTMSNRTGGDGHIWVRTGQGSSKSNLTWSTWEKLQGIFEKNIITTDPLEALDSFTTNGMYSGIFTQPFNITLLQNATTNITTASQFLVVTVNGYNLASPQLGGQIPIIMQTVYLVYNGKYVTLQRSGTWNGTSWEYKGFTKNSGISISDGGVSSFLASNGIVSSVLGSGVLIREGVNIAAGLKFTYADGILTITAIDNKKTVLTLS